MQTLILRLAIVLGCFCAVPAASGQEPDREYTFGVVPEQSPARIIRMWAPFISQLEKMSGLNIRLVTAPSVTEFHQHVAEGYYDFGYLSASAFAATEIATVYHAVARQATSLNGIVVVREDSPFRRIKDLNNTRILFPSEEAFSSSIIPRAELHAAGVRFEISYVDSHDSVYMAVARGLAEAGGGVERTFSSIPRDIRSQLRVMYRTHPYTSHPFAVSNRVDDEVGQKFTDALLEIAESPGGKILFNALGIGNIIEAKNSDWDDVREILEAEKVAEAAAANAEKETP